MDKKEYSFAQGGVTLENNITYEYADLERKDKLTFCNGSMDLINHDEIVNPLTTATT